MAYTYANQGEAIDAADMMEVDFGLVRQDRTTGAWGWDDEEIHGQGEDEALEGEIVSEVVAPSSTALVPFGASVATLEHDAEVEVETSEHLVALGAAAIEAAAGFAPRTGKVYAVILDGLTYDEAVALGVKVGRRHKVNPAIADEPYFSNARIIDHTKLPAEPVRAVGSKERDDRGLTIMQAAGLDLMLRPQGATLRELIAGGASAAKSLSVQYAMDTITLATKGQFAKTDPSARIEGGKAVLGFRMAEVSEGYREGTVVAVRASMAAKGQGGKSKKASNANVVQMANAAD